MANPLSNIFDSLSASLKKMAGIEPAEQRIALEKLQLQQSVATLLYETARTDHEVKDEDIEVANECLCQLLALSTEQAQALLTHAAQPHQRPTSYHPLVKAINEQCSVEQKYHLVECMWRVAHADHEIDMYEDHLVRKISELLYVPHRDFIAAKHRARERSS